MRAFATVAVSVAALVVSVALFVLALRVLLGGRRLHWSPWQKRSVGYALLTLLATLVYALLAAAIPGVAPALIPVMGLGLAAVILAFPDLGDTASLWFTRTVLRSQYEAQRMVEEVAEAAPAVLDLEPLAAMILERTMGTLDIRWGLFALYDRTASELRAVVARGLPGGAVQAHWPADHPLTQWLLADAVDRREEGLPYSQPAGDAPALDTAWLVPVRLREEPVGAFLYGPHTLGVPYTPTERSILDLLANQTSASVANARLFNQVARARREWLQTFDALSDGILLHDREGRVLRVNRAFARLVDRPFEQIIAQPWFDLIPAGPEPRAACMASADGGRGLVEYDLGYGDHRTLHVSVSPLAEGGETCVHVVRDVTDERALQLQLAQAEKLAAIGQMLSGVAHELNNPLTTIIGFAELLQEADVPPRTKADLQRIQRQAQRSARIVQSLLTFARQSRVQLAEVDTNALLVQTLEFVQPQLESHNIQVRLDLAADLPHTRADSGQLQQVFLNLFTNALQAMGTAHDRGVLQVSTRATGNLVHLAVQDDGPGIPRELLRRIFDPFFSTKGVGEGTGLGLSICYGIIREHGGRIWAESEPGQGATFHVELPVRHGGAETEPQPAPAPALPGGRRILIVEDEEPIVAFMTRVLEPAGHTLLTAGDGEKGLELLAQGNVPDLIVADLKMPRLDGPGLYERVARDYPQLAGRFLFITGDTVRPESEEFLSAHRLPVLRKPFGIHDLQEAVARALQR